MVVASLAYVMLSGTVPDFVVIHRMYGGIDSFPLLAVPFFILAGNLMNSAGITNRIYNFALALVGWLKGGLGHVNEPTLHPADERQREVVDAEIGRAHV